MGLKIREIVESRELEFSELSGRVLAVDAYNMLYQFLSSIRQHDGTLLMDSHGNVTSHLAGLFTRVTNLMGHGIKLVFVLDGKPPELKKREREKRAAVKIEARKMMEEAAAREDIDAVKKFASRTSHLTDDMVKEAEHLISALGLPVVHAPSEGEAQAAYMVKKGMAHAVASEDFDCLMFGADRLVRHLSISQKRKSAHSLAMITVLPEIIELSRVLGQLNITQEQLIVLGILIGTDYNPGGIHGIGPKKALGLIKKHGNHFDRIFEEVKWKESFDFGWKEVFDLIKNMPVTENLKIEFREQDRDRIFNLLVSQHDFSPERVNSSLSKIHAEAEKAGQKGLGEFF